MAPDATAGTRIVQGLDDLQTFRSQLEHVRGMVRMMERRRRPLFDTPRPARVDQRATRGFFGRLFG